MNRVVISSDRNLDYAFFTPVISLLWGTRGYRPLLLLVGEAAEWVADPRLRLALERSREVGAEVYFVPRCGGVRTSAVAQVARIFGASAPGVTEDDYLLVSDADMLPLGSWVGGGRDKSKDLQLYYSNAYDQSTYVHYPMCYVGATAKIWRDVTGCLAHEARSSGSRPVALEEAVEEGLQGVPQDEAGAWNYDERLLGQMISRWRGEHPTKVQEISRTFVEGEWRIDRSDWDATMVRVRERGSLAGVADAHVPRPGFAGENWLRVREVLALALSVEHLVWVDDYRARWVA